MEIEVTVNEQKVMINCKTRLSEVKNRFKSNADIVILNGFPVDDDYQLANGDIIALIKKGEIPTDNELEALLISRHTPNVHKKLKSSSVAVAGLGGLGSNVAISLARMGVGRLKLVDFDLVEPSNLNRQQYLLSNIGMNKTDALKSIIKDINPLVKVDISNTFITKDNIEKIFTSFDVIVEAFDKAQTKAMFITECMLKFPDTFIVGASGVAGVFDTKLLDIKFLNNKCAIIGDFINEAKVGMGLMAPRVAVAANMQANLVVRYLLKELDNDRNNKD